MTYEQFKGELFRIIMQQDEVRGKRVLLLEKGFTSRDIQLLDMIRYVNKVNFGVEDSTVHSDYIQVVWGDGDIRSMMSWEVHDYFERYREEGWEGILPDLLLKIQKAGHNMDWLHTEKDGYELSRQRLIIRAVNYDNNRYELEDCIHWHFGDIALTLYGIVSDDGQDYVTVKISRNLVTNWEISEDRLLSDAMDNTCASMPPRLYQGTDLKNKYDPEEGIFMTDKDMRDSGSIGYHPDRHMEGVMGYRLSTVKYLNGAVALFYPGVQKRLCELMGGDYLVGFTSIHEAVIHPARHQTPENIRESICEINDIFPRDEMLSNKVYRYSQMRGILMEV